ncbi:MULTISPECIES: Uma2 family endonuclease [unclassified Moorena]|uniref:Uma2 family endonuclease n=1 Tax=unclassified Moorena TaxID=2683338 RepID=UPI0013C7A073|nr:MULTISPECIES: Uma2 family endonuclease [unclassified Moorena]NEO22509.1 Uma2 family endonuclease [Moorena sp. SIO4A5]NEQ60807.1 Uma2 family endonuclease [Moorena sp. SIO4A1]
MSKTMTSAVVPNTPPIPPTQYELPCDDGIPMETERHKLQMELLTDPLYPWLAQREDGYFGGNMFLYFSTEQIKNQDFRGPDVFVVLGVPKAERLSWVVWEEGKAPDVIIELISDSTANTDKTTKKVVYQDQVRVPEYFWYDPFNPEDFAGFRLHNGVYQPLTEDEEGRLISERLGLALVRWQGVYKNNVDTTWLRWATLEGIVLPTAEEIAVQAQQQAAQAQQQAAQAQQQATQAQQQAIQAQQQATQAQQEAAQAQQRAEQLAARLRAMGVDPDQV